MAKIYLPYRLQYLILLTSFGDLSGKKQRHNENLNQRYLLKELMVLKNEKQFFANRVTVLNYLDQSLLNLILSRSHSQGLQLVNLEEQKS